MCIRDRRRCPVRRINARDHLKPPLNGLARRAFTEPGLLETCLLYTSDAADERSSVDLGGRRIIKKKKKAALQYGREHVEKHERRLDYTSTIVIITKQRKKYTKNK